MDASPAGRNAASPQAPLLGTRFRVHPQAPFIPGYEEPEVVWISTPPGRIGDGPADHRIYVADPLAAKTPYQGSYFPPYPGVLHPPAEPGPGGHFDHIPIRTRQFMAAHAFACVRRVMDICESYLGREIPWFFLPTYERLEIVPHLPWTNAQSGYGFLELGEDDTREEPCPYALNFDVIAHETGHLVLFGVMGVPERWELDTEYLAYHEFAADFISLIGLMHFDTALDRMLRRTKGNLFISNELDRVAELLDERQIRKASHSLKMGDVGREVHDLSRPFTGAMFDALLEIFQLILLERGLASLDTRRLRSVRESLTQMDIDHEYAVSQEAYRHRHFAVKAALQEARDIVADALFRSWDYLGPGALSFRNAASAIVRAVEEGRGQRFADTVRDNFVWRDIL